jgi:hypothetical protein
LKGLKFQKSSTSVTDFFSNCVRNFVNSPILTLNIIFLEFSKSSIFSSLLIHRASTKKGVWDWKKTGTAKLRVSFFIQFLVSQLHKVIYLLFSWEIQNATQIYKFSYIDFIFIADVVTIKKIMSFFVEALSPSLFVTQRHTTHVIWETDV